MAKKIFFEGPVMWSHIDANRHMRHSAYADFAAQARLFLLDSLKLDASVFEELMVGPILFREELVFLREVRLNDIIKVSCELTRCRPDASRWSIRHEIFRKDGVHAADITVDGAWLDQRLRKLALLPPELAERFMRTPKSEDFVMETASPKVEVRIADKLLLEQFMKAQEDVKKIGDTPPDETLLQLYGLYKQATEGNVTTDKPRMFDFRSKAKHEAWRILLNTPPDQAMRKYVQLVDTLKAAR